MLSFLRRRSITSCDALYFISLSSLVDFSTVLNLFGSPWQGNIYLLRLRFNHGGVHLKMTLTCDCIPLLQPTFGDLKTNINYQENLESYSVQVHVFVYYEWRRRAFQKGPYNVSISIIAWFREGFGYKCTSGFIKDLKCLSKFHEKPCHY